MLNLAEHDIIITWIQVLLGVIYNCMHSEWSLVRASLCCVLALLSIGSTLGRQKNFPT